MYYCSNNLYIDKVLHVDISIINFVNHLLTISKKVSRLLFSYGKTIRISVNLVSRKYLMFSHQKSNQYPNTVAQVSVTDKNALYVTCEIVYSCLSQAKI